MIRALAHLGWIGFIRIVRSRRTAVLLVLSALAGIVVLVWPPLARILMKGEAPGIWTFEDFTHWVVRSLFGVLGPLVALAYGTAAIGDERESGTLVYLLLRPLPRGGIFAARLAAALGATLAIGGGIFAGLCILAGEPGRRALITFGPSIALGLSAHGTLFAIFGVFFKRATILALGYAFFVEAFLGNMPGIIQRASISFFIRSAVFGLGGIESENPLFLPVSPPAAMIALGTATLAFAALGWWGFRTREYRPSEA
ncbi:MAG: ABC transporter permease [Planctomycetes bacterium]|nr:ABC transporter permease [Planctomycetota bacterium]